MNSIGAQTGQAGDQRDSWVEPQRLSEPSPEREHLQRAGAQLDAALDRFDAALRESARPPAFLRR